MTCGILLLTSCKIRSTSECGILMCSSEYWCPTSSSTAALSAWVYRDHHAEHSTAAAAQPDGISQQPAVAKSMWMPAYNCYPVKLRSWPAPASATCCKTVMSEFFTHRQETVTQCSIVRSYVHEFLRWLGDFKMLRTTATAITQYLCKSQFVCTMFFHAHNHECCSRPVSSVKNYNSLHRGLYTLHTHVLSCMLNFTGRTFIDSLLASKDHLDRLVEVELWPLYGHFSRSQHVAPVNQNYHVQTTYCRCQWLQYLC